MLSVIQAQDDNHGGPLLELIRKEYPTYHPVLSIVKIAHDIKADLELQFQCHKTVAQYVQPQLKSIEVKQKQIEARRVVVSLFDENEVYDAELIESSPLNAIVEDELSRL